MEQLEGLRAGPLESAVSPHAKRFDPIAALDDEFYTYTGEKTAQAIVWPALRLCRRQGRGGRVPRPGLHGVR